MANVKNVAPGIGLCAAIAIPCWFLGEALPVVGGPVFAILIGMVIALWWKQPARGTVQDGIAFTAKKVLQYAVILLGFGLNLAQIAAVGAESLPIILTTIATALIVGYILYRVLSVDSAIATLIAVGSSICGGSAIAATAPSAPKTSRWPRPSRSSFCSTWWRRSSSQLWEACSACPTRASAYSPAPP